MDSELTVSTAALGDLAANLADQAARLRADADALAQASGRLRARWHGEAAEAFTVSHVRAHAQLRARAASLAEASALATRLEDLYARADAELAARVGG